MKKIYKNLRGFTLIELLVVISVLGILAAVALVSFTGSQKQARDTRRKSDISQYRLAMENFANKNNGLYPSRTSNQRADTVLCADLGLTSCPQDPRFTKDTSYVYTYQTNGTGAGTITATIYVIWAKIENVTSGTTKYWVVCSNGKSAETTTAPAPVLGACPI